MQDITSILNQLQQTFLSMKKLKKLFISFLNIKKVKRKQLLEQPGFVSKYRNYVVKGALRAFVFDNNGQEHTISLAVDNGWIGDPGSFLLQEPATLFVEAMEDSLLLQWSYASEQVLLKEIPLFALFMQQKAQLIAVSIQRRVISHISQSAEERYNDFSQKHPEYLRRFPLYVVASYLGMTREFLSKIRNQKVGHLIVISREPVHTLLVIYFTFYLNHNHDLCFSLSKNKLLWKAQFILLSGLS